MRRPADAGPGADTDAGERADQTAAERNPKYPEALPDGNPKTPATARRSEGGASGPEASPAAGARRSNYSADSPRRRRKPLRRRQRPWLKPSAVDFWVAAST